MVDSNEQHTKWLFKNLKYAGCASQAQITSLPSYEPSCIISAQQDETGVSRSCVVLEQGLVYVPAEDGTGGWQRL